MGGCMRAGAAGRLMARFSMALKDAAWAYRSLTPVINPVRSPTPGDDKWPRSCMGQLWGAPHKHLEKRR
jgi:hypothetical protein